MNTPQVQVPVTQPQPVLPVGTLPFPSILNIKSENCTSIVDLLKQYWWVLLLLVVAFLYYRNSKSSKHSEDEDSVPQSSK